MPHDKVSLSFSIEHRFIGCLVAFEPETIPLLVELHNNTSHIEQKPRYSLQ
jgi:hypothetical protein